jgi:hypothetical protein
MVLARSLMFGFLAASAAFASTAVSVWQVDSLTKVFPDDPLEKNRASDQAWLVARNGHTSVQMALRAREAVAALEVTVKLGGGLLTQVRRVGYVPVRSNPPGSPADEVVRTAPSKFPDPLLEDSPFRLDANQTAAVWITVYAPPKAVPGVYKGEAVIRAGGIRLASLPFRIQVGRATVPPKQTLRVTNWFDLDEANVARYYDLASNAERYWEVLGNIGRVLADHKQNVILTPVLSLTDARVTGGSLTYDFSRLNRWVETFRKAGTAEIIEGGHVLDRASGYDSPLKIPAFVVENGEVRRESLGPDDPRAEAQSQLVPAGALRASEGDGLAGSIRPARAR